VFNSPTARAGWLFADLMLVLAIIAFGTGKAQVIVPDALPPPSATTTTSTTTSTSTTTTLPTGVDREYVCVRINTNATLLTGPPSDARDSHVDELSNALSAALAEAGMGQRRAGIVLSFGRADRAARGREIAQAFNSLVLPNLDSFSNQVDEVLYPEVATRGFWDGPPIAGKPTGQVEVDVYPLTGGTDAPLPPGSEPC